MNLNGPLVSVVIPMYNAEETVIKTLNSVEKQDYKFLEIIVVDDGSTDQSARLVEDFACSKPHLNLTLIKKKNGGVSSARNTGMKASTGEYIALVDADDQWLPQKIASQLSVFHEHPEIDLLAANRNNEHVKRFFFKKFDYLTHISSHLLLYKTFLAPSTTIFKRSIVDSIGFFDETQRYAEEGNYWIRICKDNRCVLQNEKLVIAGDGKPDYGYSGLSSNLKQMELGELKNMRDALKLKVVGGVEYAFLVVYSVLKYIRRILVVKMRK